MLPVAFTILFVVGTALCKDSANSYFENLLSTSYVKEVKALNLDPAALADFHTEFQDRVIIIGKVKGKADFTEGKLTGLSGAKRHSDCKTDASSSTNYRAINCTMIFDKIKISYDGKMKYGKMPKVSIKGEGKLKNISLSVEIVKVTPMKPWVKTLSFAQLGTIEAKFTGLGPLNRFTKALEDGFKKHVQTEIYSESINQKLLYVLNRAVAEVPMPSGEYF